MRLSRLWLLAATVGLLGAALLFDARPGVNYLIWTAAAVTGLLLATQPRDETRWRIATPLSLALLLAGDGLVTANAPFHALIVAMVAALLALAILLLAQRPLDERYGPVYIVTAPVRALAKTIEATLQTLLRSFDAAGRAGTSPWLRGSLLAVPIAVVFALLFATADPLFARGRDAVADILASWSLAPRVAFGGALTLFVLGAYALAMGKRELGPQWTSATGPAGGTHPALPAAAWRGLGPMERTMTVAAAALVSWLFVVFQLSYMFLGAPGIAGTGLTFARYAREGFGELAVVGTVAIVLIVAVEELARALGDSTPPSRRMQRVAEFALLGAVLCVLASALRRVTLYERAYGFTTARVDAQAYMALALVILVLVAVMCARRFDTPLLARQIMTASVVTVALMGYWNDEAWVARRNLERFAATGRIDVEYLARLGPDAYPQLLAMLPLLPDAERSNLRTHLWQRSRDYVVTPDRWFEWNVRRSRARAAITSMRSD